jgi:hypothetical protein
LRELQKQTNDTNNQTEQETAKIDTDSLPSSNYNSDHNPFNPEESINNSNSKTTSPEKSYVNNNNTSCFECKNNISADKKAFF